MKGPRKQKLTRRSSKITIERPANGLALDDEKHSTSKVQTRAASTQWMRSWHFHFVIHQYCKKEISIGSCKQPRHIP
uniref:Uncharacterized protein n=1 Tax=Arundo donax TaxID=35708 RepID=A0A0A8YUA4_ARUDO